MQRIVPFIIIILVSHTLIFPQSSKRVTSAQAIHLVEYKLDELHAGKFEAQSVTFDKDRCVVVGKNKVHELEVIIDSQTAHVLEMKRDGLD